MNALLRMTAMVIHESTDPQASKAEALAVIEAALNEPEESVQ